MAYTIMTTHIPLPSLCLSGPVPVMALWCHLWLWCKLLKVLPKKFLKPTGLFGRLLRSSSTVWVLGYRENFFHSFGFELTVPILVLFLWPETDWQTCLMKLKHLGAGYIWQNQTLQWRSYKEEKSRKAKITRTGGRKEKRKEETRRRSWKVRRPTLTRGFFNFWFMDLSLWVDG